MTIKFDFTMPFYHIHGQTAEMTRVCRAATRILKDAAYHLDPDFDDAHSATSTLRKMFSGHVSYDDSNFVQKILTEWRRWPDRENIGQSLLIDVLNPAEGIWFRSVIYDNRDIAVKCMQLFARLSGLRGPWQFTWSEESSHGYRGGVTVVTSRSSESHEATQLLDLLPPDSRSPCLDRESDEE